MTAVSSACTGVAAESLESTCSAVHGSAARPLVLICPLRLAHQRKPSATAARCSSRSSSTMAATAPHCAATKCTSGGAERTDKGTAMAPMRASANSATTNSARLRSISSTRSPGATPCCTMPAATRVTSNCNSRQRQRRAPSTRASRSGNVAAARSSKAYTLRGRWAKQRSSRSPKCSSLRMAGRVPSQGQDEGEGKVRSCAVIPAICNAPQAALAPRSMV